MAAGSTRILDGNETAKRKLSFVAFELVFPVTDTKTEEYAFLEEQGFHVVEHISNVTEGTLEDAIKHFDPKQYEYPVDGLIIEHESKGYGRSLGATGHHESCRIALKWQDETVETQFEDACIAKPYQIGVYAGKTGVRIRAFQQKGGEDFKKRIHCRRGKHTKTTTALYVFSD